MIATLIVVVVLAGFAAWLVAAWSLISLLRLAPEPLAFLRHASWWNRAKMEAAIGPAGLTHLKRFKKALLAFFAAIVCGFALALVQLMLNKAP